MNIVITGGSGFLGKKLGKQLIVEGHSVKNLDIRPCSELETQIVDVRDASQLSGAFQGAEVVFHLASLIEAGESVSKPAEYCQTNILGTLNVLQAMVEQNVKKIIFSSSAAVYGEPLKTPITEDDRTLPVNPYGMTKLAMEGLVSSFSYTHGITGVALRYFNLYGPGEDHQPETHAIPRFIDQILNDKEITVYGDGMYQRDYVYIDDIVRAHILSLELEGGYHYMNLSGAKPATVLEIVEKLSSIMGKQPTISFMEARPGDPRVLFASSEKAERQLGWSVQVDLDTGLKRTVEWFTQR